MEITGARWRLDRAEAVLRIRALRSSGDRYEYWEFHLLTGIPAQSSQQVSGA